MGRLSKGKKMESMQGRKEGIIDVNVCMDGMVCCEVLEAMTLAAALKLALRRHPQWLPTHLILHYMLLEC